MMNKSLLILPLLLIGITCGITGCKKASAPVTSESWKKEIITGTWKQKDLVLSVSVKLGGQTIPAGSSMITLAPLLAQALKNPALAEGLICTKNNTYAFNPDNSYTITGCTQLVLPKAGNSGNWQLTVYDAVVSLTGSGGDADPHWINNITSNTLNLSVTLSIPGVGNLPLGLILTKQ